MGYTQDVLNEDIQKLDEDINNCSVVNTMVEMIRISANIAAAYGEEEVISAYEHEDFYDKLNEKVNNFKSKCSCRER